MWDFTPFGLLMPAAVPMDKADEKLTEGKYDLQVRGRAASHLQYFMDNYMEPGSFHDEIELTPSMDYNARFYTTREAYADGIRGVILDIDYKKFKPEAERLGDDGQLMYGTKDDTSLYHNVLNSIWGSVCRIGSPGGSYGKFSKSNPNGYSNHWSAGPLGASFGSRDADLFDDDSFEDGIGSYEPSSTSQALSILNEMELDNIPTSEWRDYLKDWEYELIKPYMRQARKDERHASRHNKKNSKNKTH
jgi:hypothetical protein